MNELIRIDYSNAERPTVSGRELHQFLGIETPYKQWFDRMLEYGFSEGESYCTILCNRSDGLPGKPLTDHQLTVPMAKELCMIQRNDRGKQARQYFLAVEEQWNSPDAVMQRALSIANARVERLRGEKLALQADNDAMRPKALFADAVCASSTSILIGDLAKLLQQNGVQMGQNRLFEWMRRNGYLIGRHGSNRNMPTQRAMEMGLFVVKETAVTHSDGHVSVSKTPKVTGKGQVYFINKFKSA